jgi:hypothetical protein
MPRVLRSVTKWIAGILATVIGTVLIWYIQQRLTPRPVESTIALEGRVVDNNSNKFIHGAHVHLTSEDFSGEQLTDTGGRYYFVIRPKQVPVVGQLRIEAAGYQVYDLTQRLNPGDNLWEIPLVAAVIPTGGGPPPGSSLPTSIGSRVGSVAVRTLNPRIVQSLPAYSRRANAVVLGAPNRQ